MSVSKFFLQLLKAVAVFIVSILASTGFFYLIGTIMYSFNIGIDHEHLFGMFVGLLYALIVLFLEKKLLQKIHLSKAVYVCSALVLPALAFVIAVHVDSNTQTVNSILDYKIFFYLFFMAVILTTSSIIVIAVNVLQFLVKRLRLRKNKQME